MVDERPTPKYGELAPEGWKWNPPAAPAAHDNPARHALPGSSAPTAPPGVESGPPAGGPVPSSARQKPLNGVDVTLTSVLLFFGVLISASMIPALFDFGTVLSQAAAMQGYATFTATPSADTAGSIAGVVTIVLELAAIAISVRRLSRRRLAFPVPIIFGLVTFVIWMAVIAYAFVSDPGFVDSVLTTPPAT